MIGRLVLFVFGVFVDVLLRSLWFAVGLTLSALIRLGPGIFRWAVESTGATLARIDQATDGRLTDNEPLTYLAAGGLWALAGFTAPWLLGLIFFGETSFFSPTALVVGFVFGLVVGWRAQHLPGWGWWREQGRVQLGENR